MTPRLVAAAAGGVFLISGFVLGVTHADAHSAALSCASTPGYWHAVDADTDLVATFHFSDGTMVGVPPAGGIIPTSKASSYFVTWADGFRLPASGSTPTPTGCGTLPSTTIVVVPHCPPGLPAPGCTVGTTLPPPVESPTTSLLLPTSVVSSSPVLTVSPPVDLTTVAAPSPVSPPKMGAATTTTRSPATLPTTGAGSNTIALTLLGVGAVVVGGTIGLFTRKRTP